MILKGIFSGLGALVIALMKGEAIPSVSLILPALLLGFTAYGLSIFLYVRAQNVLGAALYSGIGNDLTILTFTGRNGGIGEVLVDLRHQLLIPIFKILYLSFHILDELFVFTDLLLILFIELIELIFLFADLFS